MHNYPLPLSFDVSNFRSTFQNFTRLNTRGSDQLLLLTSPSLPPPPRILTFPKLFFPFLYIQHILLHERIFVSSTRDSYHLDFIVSKYEEDQKRERKKRKKWARKESGKRWKTFRASKCCAPLCVGSLDLSSIFSSEALNVNSTSRGRVSLFKLLCALIFTRA